jgi:hypothetical protein
MRSTCSISCVALVLLAAAAAGQDAPAGPRVRAADDDARRLLAIGEQESPTVRYLLAALEDSDLIVLVSYEPPSPWSQSPDRRHHGTTRLLAAAHGYRYVAIWIDSQWSAGGRRARLVALLAHELQHALEIARAREVVDQESMLALFGRIGRQLWPNHFETDAAGAVESRVLGELSAAVSRPQFR